MPYTYQDQRTMYTVVRSVRGVTRISIYDAPVPTSQAVYFRSVFFLVKIFYTDRNGF